MDYVEELSPSQTPHRTMREQMILQKAPSPAGGFHPCVISTLYTPRKGLCAGHSGATVTAMAVVPSLLATGPDQMNLVMWNVDGSAG
jgi:hypothetical protein